MPLSSTQKAALAQFISFTQADKKIAERTLKANSWNVQQAVNVYFSTSSSSGAAGGGSTLKLNQMFDKYRDNPKDSPDKISISGTMKYFEDLSISLDSIAVLVISELLQSPTMGDITRDGFVQGWYTHAAQSLPSQRKIVDEQLATLPQPTQRLNPHGLFRRVYKHTFEIALPDGQKVVPLEMAIEYWKLLFSPQGFDWTSGRHSPPWLPLWTQFLQDKYKKSVNKDLWQQTLLFALKTVDDPSLNWWNQESSWPAVIDDFVQHMQQLRAFEGLNGDGMEIS